MKNLFKILQNKKNKQVAIGLLLAFILLFVFLLLKTKTEFTDNAYLKADIVVIRPKVSGYIVKAISNDNQFLKAGQLIAKIDDRDYILKVHKAKSNVKSARSNLNSLIHKVKIKSNEVKNSFANKNIAKATLDRANKDFKRAKELVKDQAISQAILDQTKESQINAENAYMIAVSNFESSKYQQEIAVLEMESAQSSLKAYKSELDLARMDLENTEIKATTDGRVSKKNIQVGQLVSSNMALGYLVQNNIWVIANFKEVQTGEMKNNQPAIVTIDSFPGKKFKAKVHSLSPATGAEFSILPPENATGNFTKIVQRVPVKVTFDDEQDLSLLKPGLSCEVKVIF